jgi:acetyl-CoA carboxylase carboxyl transferase subunit beta
MTDQAGAGSARGVLDIVLDSHSFTPWPGPSITVEADAEYAGKLAQARRRTGLAEAVITGEGRVGGHRVAVVACEFEFLGGSIGVAAAELVVAAAERATRQRLPLLALPASGGTRMQEGAVAFLQMVKITGAVGEHIDAGLPYLVYLRHPTTGGVLASWASLGHLTFAAPGALIGFLGPRVYEQMYGRPFPPGVQRAENLFDHGIVDAVCDPAAVRAVLARTLSILAPPTPPPTPRRPVAVVPPPGDAWESVLISRQPARPDGNDLLAALAEQTVLLNGTGEGQRCNGVVAALARVAGIGCVYLGHTRADRQHPNLPAAAMRVAARAFAVAGSLGLPVITVIDTAGAELGADAEEHAIAGQIARCLAGMIGLPTPSIAVLLGQGAGGAALAWLPADRVIAVRHAWLAPLPPEGASAIVHRDTDHAADLARAQGIDAASLAANAIVDVVVDEPDDPAALAARLGAVIADELRGLVEQDRDRRLAARRRRYRRIGLPGFTTK